jgi:DNA repair exonuclease SbcCD nuclease subunit
MKILHTADLHLKEYGDERWKTLQKLIDIAKKEKVDLFVICGDLFDKEFKAELLRSKIREIFSDNNFKILLLPGNHDKEAYETGFYFGEDVILLNNLNEPFEYKNVVIWGLPFEPIEGEKVLAKLNSLANKLASNKINILLYHGELLDASFSRKDFGEEGEERYMPVKLSYFSELNIKYVLAGHFHSRFEVWQLENGGYFIYPGSPISITKKEIGRRKVNLFEIGESPKEYSLDTPHFEEITIKLDPFLERDPLEIINESLVNVHPQAKIILTIKGYINSRKIKKNELELTEEIKRFVKNKYLVEELKIEFKDLYKIFEKDLFIRFIEKLEKFSYEEEKKKQMCEILIRAMLEAEL